MKNALARWRSKPSSFAEEFLKINLWDGDGKQCDQRMLVDSWPRHRRVVARSGHKTGKSTSGAVLAWWAATLHPKARVILTAPTSRQIEEVIWREVHALHKLARKAGHHIGGRLYDSAERGWVGIDGQQILGISTNDADRFSGISGPYVFYIVDEGAGVEDAIKSAIDGNMAGGAWFMSFGNPTQTSGWFYDAFHTEADDYLCLHLSSEDTPNARGQVGKPGLATREYVEGRREVWGEDSLKYQVRVRGDFPGTAASSVFSLDAFDSAVGRWTATPPPHAAASRLEAGLDCARFGDDRNALVIRRGNYVFQPHRWSGQDSIQVAGTARRALLDMLTPLERQRRVKPLVKVDVIGIGAGVFDQLAAFSDIEAVPVNVASSPTAEGADDDRYENLRAQVWFEAAAFTRAQAMLPPDKELRADCLAPQYRYGRTGRTQVEPKDDIKKRLDRSPDTGDAYCLAVYNAPVWDGRPYTIEDLHG